MKIMLFYTGKGGMEVQEKKKPLTDGIRYSAELKGKDAKRFSATTPKYLASTVALNLERSDIQELREVVVQSSFDQEDYKTFIATLKRKSRKFNKLNEIGE